MTEMFSVQLAVDAVGSAILHSLWQGALIAVLMALTLLMLRGASANSRYAIACLALAMLTVGWLATAIGYAGQVYRLDTPAPAPSDAMGPTAIGVRVGPPVLGSLVAAGATLSSAGAERLASWSRPIVLLWFIGVLGLSVRLALGWLLVARIRNAAHRELAGDWPERLAAMVAHLRICRPVQVVQSALVQVPMLIGWLRPVILIPAGVMSGLTTAQLEAVIAHELAHVRRHDYLANILQNVAEILLFYHPACWWISKQIRAEREHCCDDIAVGVCGSEVLYAGALADLEMLRGKPSVPALAATDGILLGRIRRLVAPVTVARTWSPTWTAATVPLIVLALVVWKEPAVSTQAESVPNSEGVVQGRVVDARSLRPVPGATVEFSGPNGSSTAPTDAEGRYEIRHLEPGEYRIEARARGYVPARYGQLDVDDRGSTLHVIGGRSTTGINLRLEAAGVITGRVFDDRGDGLAGVEIELLADRHTADGVRATGVGFAQTEAEGAFKLVDVLPGEYYVRAFASPEVRPSRTEGHAYVSTFYPGVERSEYGQRVHLSSGQKLFGIDFSLAVTPTHRVSGTVVDPSADPRAQTRVHMRAIGLNSVDAQYDAPVAGDGRFEVPRVVPGDYMISVFQPRSMTSRWISAARFVIVDDDVVGLELRAQSGASISGRIIRDASATRALDPAGVSIVFEHRMSDTRAGWTGVVARGAGGAMRVGPDGVFSIESPGGTSVVRVSELPANWMLKAVRLDGTDITDQEIDFGEGIRRVEVVLTDRVSRVRGSVTDRSGRPVRDSSVIVFAENAILSGESSRLVRDARSGSDGQFELTGLPSADYLAVAVDHLPGEAWRNPDVLNRLRNLAIRFHLEEGEEQVVSLRSAPAPAGLIP